MSDNDRFDSIDDGLKSAAAVETTTRLDANERFSAIEAQLARGAARMAGFESELRATRLDLAANTSVTQGIRDDTQVIRDVMVAGRVGLKVLGGIGTVAKYLGYIAGACVAIYAAAYAITHGGAAPPHP